MIGWAIMSQRDSLSLCMNHIFWKHLLNIPLDIDDLYQIDSTRHDFLKYQMVPGVFPETFVADLGSGEDVELCDGGSEREVTEQNRDEYVRLFIQKYFEQDRLIYDTIIKGIKAIASH